MEPIDWLMEGDPSIRWQVMLSLLESPAGQVRAERRRVSTEGWGARLLALQDSDGQWGGGAYSPKWTSTTYTLLLLRHLGIDPRSEAARAATDLVGEHVVMGAMGAGKQPFFAYQGETCITGMCLALAAYFGRHKDGAERVVGWLLEEQLEDGGWNCLTRHGSRRSSFNTTITVLEGLLEYERAAGPSQPIAQARLRGHEYLLERRLFRSLRTGEVIDPRWTRFSFPPRWHYDVLRGLDYLWSAGVAPDSRWGEAIALVESRRRQGGVWLLQNRHPGREHFQMEPGAGKPSRWNTLRALRVLKWYARD